MITHLFTCHVTISPWAETGFTFVFFGCCCPLVVGWLAGWLYVDMSWFLHMLCVAHLGHVLLSGWLEHFCKVTSKDLIVQLILWCVMDILCYHPSNNKGPHFPTFWASYKVWYEMGFIHVFIYSFSGGYVVNYAPPSGIIRPWLQLILILNWSNLQNKLLKSHASTSPSLQGLEQYMF